MARLNDGGHVVAWVSNGSPLVFPAPSAERSICTQRFGAEGSRAGAETCIGASDPTTSEGGPSVAALADGGYVVAWATAGDVSLTSSVIRTQRYDANGSAVGGVQQANENTGFLGHVKAAAVATGGYVLIWTRLTRDDPQGPSTASLVVLRRFGTDGLPAGPELTMNTGFNQGALIAALDGGGYVIVRSDNSSAIGRELPVLATRYDSQFAQVGPEITVSNSGGGLNTAITSLVGGGFAIGWTDSASGEARVQRFAGDGSPVGTPVPVDAPVPIFSCPGTTGHPPGPCPAVEMEVALAGLQDGGFVATWTADPTHSGIARVFARRFAADGITAGPVIAVSSATGIHISDVSSATGVRPSIVALPGGSVAITWDAGSTEVTEDIFERRLDAQSLLGSTP